MHTELIKIVVRASNRESRQEDDAQAPRRVTARATPEGPEVLRASGARAPSGDPVATTNRT